ncbi:MAG: hypothetical protein V1904_06805 [Bacteroidota bacterium]
MPLDPMISDSILGTFKNMVEDCKSKNISGEDFDAMCKCYARMEELAKSTDDMNIFNGTVMQENLYGKFSDHYSRALGAHAKQAYSSGEKGYDDASLLKGNIDAMKQAIQRLQDAYKEALRMASEKYQLEAQEKGLDMAGRIRKKDFDSIGGIEAFKKQVKESNKESKKMTPNIFDNTVEVEALQNPEPLIGPIQKMIDLGEQPGMTFPKYLRLQIETGVDKAMEGTGVMRSGLVYSLEFTEAIPSNPYYIESAKRKIEAFDKLAAGNRFGVPDMKEINFANDDIDREFEPQIKKWEAIKNLWEKMIWNLYDWSLSYCSFAPKVKPWVDAPDPVAATIHTQETEPGIFKEWEILLMKYFGMSFMDIFKHPTFAFEVEKSYLWNSQEIIEFIIEEVYQHCKPFYRLPDPIIKKRASFYPYPNHNTDREMNPDLHLPNWRYRDFYNKTFGAGRYESKMEVAKKDENAKAAPWNWATFKYK